MNGRGRIPHWVCQRHSWWNSKDGFKQTAEERPSARQKPQPCCRDKRCQKQQLDDWAGVPHAVKQVGVCITPLNLPKSNWQLFCSRCKWSLTFILSQSDVRRAFFYFFFFIFYFFPQLQSNKLYIEKIPDGTANVGKRNKDQSEYWCFSMK